MFAELIDRVLEEDDLNRVSLFNIFNKVIYAQKTSFTLRNASGQSILIAGRILELFRVCGWTTQR